MPDPINRQFRLKRRPNGRVAADDFDFVKAPVPTPGPGEVLVRVLYISMEPIYRLWMTDTDHDLPPVKIGDVVRGVGLGRVVASNAEGWNPGDLAGGMFGWQDYAVVPPPGIARLSRIREHGSVPLTTMLGACGSTGFCAYFGLLDIGKPKQGETVVVSAAAGAVGSVAGQIAKLKGCRVVGIAGGAAKCRLLTDELGFDAAVDYKRSDWREALAAATPNGIDVNFENVGGEIMGAVIDRMNHGGRVVLCGLITGYNDGERREGHLQALGNFIPIFTHRLTVQGFVFTDFAPRFGEAVSQLSQWVAAGQIKPRETVVDGLEHTPEALNRLFAGNNIGKLLVKVSEP
jgi:NADPH-dependent curcumin reductase CurA